MQVNGTVKFGTFLCFFGGVVMNQGFEALDKNLWVGIAVIVLGLLVDITGINSVSRGINEMMRVRDLERKAGVRKG